MSNQSLPVAWVEALFRRFTVTWGAQKVAAAFAPPTGHEPDWMEDVLRHWGQQLGGFGADALKRALQASIDSGREWPPTLPEFKALCRDFNRPEQSANLPALPGPREPVPRAAIDVLRGAGGIDGIAARDPLFWARYPASRKAVEMLADAGQRDHRLRAILRQHLADPYNATVRDGHPLADEARRELIALAENPPAYLRAAA